MAMTETFKEMLKERLEAMTPNERERLAVLDTERIEDCRDRWLEFCERYGELDERTENARTAFLEQREYVKILREMVWEINHREEEGKEEAEIISIPKNVPVKIKVTFKSGSHTTIMARRFSKETSLQIRLEALKYAEELFEEKAIRADIVNVG